MFAAAALLIAAVGCKSVSEEQKLADYKAGNEKFMEEYRASSEKIQADSALTEDQRDSALEKLYNESVDKYVSERFDILKKDPSGQLAVAVVSDIWNMIEEPQQQEALGLLKGAAAQDSTILKYKSVMEAKKNTAAGSRFTDFTVTQDPENPENSTVKFSDYVGKGKYVLVDFWASWCGPCKREIPNIAAVYDKYHGDDFDVLSVAVWDDPADTKAAAAEHGVVWSQIINAQRIPTEIYGIQGIPHIMLVGPDGTILKRDLRGADIEKAVSEALGR